MNSRIYITRKVCLVKVVTLSALMFGGLLLFGVGYACAASKPVIAQESALAGPESVIIRGKINPSGDETACELQYVSDGQYEATGYAAAESAACTPATLEASTDELNVIAEIRGLQIDTGYHFRFVASNAIGEEFGADTTFATFGVEIFEAALLGANGEAFTQAGGHPYEYTTNIVLNHSTEPVTPSGNLENAEVELPPGLVGDPAATPSECTTFEAELKRCEEPMQIGTMTVGYGTEGGLEHEIVQPLFNIVPPNGVVAEFSARFNLLANAFVYAKVNASGGYTIDAYSERVTPLVDVNKVQITIWGVPGAATHDPERACPVDGQYEMPCKAKSTVEGEVPFLSNPTSCTGGPLREQIDADSYQVPDRYVDKVAEMPPITGCNGVSFTPEISVVPETSSSESPTGLRVDVHVPQHEEATVLASANLKDASVILPEGVAVNPSEARGLVGCPLLNGDESHAGQVGIDLENNEAANCPDASKIGKVELNTPLIGHTLPGYVYLAQQGDAGLVQGANPFGSLIALYIEIDDPITGVIVKLAGRVSLDPISGQLTTTFDENPQLPFEDLTLELFGGQRAPLATPMTCGSYRTTSLLEPWSHEAPGEVGTPDAAPFSNFEITSMAGGGACGSPGFGPSLVAGTTNNRATSYSPLTTTLARKDGEQAFKRVSITMPKGLVGMISNVARCDEAEADAGTCPASTQIGHVVVQAGVGSEPVTLPEPGKQEDPVYLTGSYEGAPFGLAIVVHPEAGPFDLAEGVGTPSERPVVVRAKIEVDPHTAQVSIVTDPTGLYSTPTILQGVPVDVQSVSVIVDRPNFIFNPTNCEPMSVTGTIGSAEGASAKVSSRFQAAECRSLSFKPKFSAFTHAGHTRRNGAYLRVVVKSAFGQANIGEVHVSLPPKVLVARDSTLNLACNEAQFAANPANCPSGSFVGTATATTPVLSKALTGPAIFVSHGGAKFPDLDVVLQGEGVTVILTGNTSINEKTQITSSTFASVPDVPVSRFVLTLPSKSNSALAGYGNMCARPLTMPTTITGQNGAVIEQNTSIDVEGCSLKLAVLSHEVKGRNATVSIYVPSAGKVHAEGSGLNSQTKTIKGHGILNFNLHERKAGRLITQVHLSFMPANGKTAKPQSKRVALTFAR
jgi:hypothetical protein